MRRKSVLWVLVGAGAVVLAALLWSTLHRRPATSISREMMGTIVNITVFARDDDSARRAVAKAFDRIEELEDLLSSYRSESDVTRCNRKAARRPVRVSAATFEVIEAALAFSEQSGGAFDVTVGPYIDLWRRCADAHRLPTQEELDRAGAIVGWRLVELNGDKHTVRFSREGVAIDLGGIAKGYIIDEATTTLRDSGVERALVNAGGDVYAMGLKPGGRRWLVGIQDPLHPGAQAATVETVAVSDGAVATSGNYRRFTVIEGRRYSHIIDPRTGLPADAVPSVTVTAPDATTADALATALSVLGVEEGLRLVEGLPGVEALMIRSEDGELRFHSSSGFAK